MSVARVTVVKSARKSPGKCGKCEKTIKKKQGYRWWKLGFRSRFKRVRCLECPAPRASELESNDSMSSVWSAQETMEDALAAATTREDVEAAVQEAGNGVGEAIDSWNEKKDNLESAFPNGSPAIEAIDEYISNAESLQEALEGFSVEGDEDGDDAPSIEDMREQGQRCWDDNCQL